MVETDVERGLKMTDSIDNIIICPFCHTESNRGVKVCIGCQAEVQYGISLIMFWFCLIAPGILGALLSHFILNDFGMGFFVIVPAIAGAYFGIKKYKDKVTFFRTMRHSK